jgi:hypothetical protein
MVRHGAALQQAALCCYDDIGLQVMSESFNTAVREATGVG